MANAVAAPSFSLSTFLFGFLCGVIVLLVAVVVWANQTPGPSSKPVTQTTPSALKNCTQSQAKGYTDLPTYCAAYPTDTCCTANSPQLPNTGNTGTTT